MPQPASCGWCATLLARRPGGDELICCGEGFVFPVCSRHLYVVGRPCGSAAHEQDEHRFFLGGLRPPRPSHRVGAWGNPVAPCPCLRARPSRGWGHGATGLPHTPLREPMFMLGRYTPEEYSVFCRGKPVTILLGIVPLRSLVRARVGASRRAWPTAILMKKRCSWEGCALPNPPAGKP